VFVSRGELFFIINTSTLTQFPWGIDSHDHSRMQPHIFYVIELFLAFWVTLDYHTLHFAVFLGHAFLYQFFDKEVVNELVVQKL
jgi:hypothetical protein